MTSSLTSGGHYPEKHDAYNIYDLSPNIVSSFNNYNKSWLMHAYNIRAISGDDLIIETSGNNRIIFQENDHSYNLCDLIGFKVLKQNLIATDSSVRIPISYNNYSFANPATLGTSLTLNGSYVDLTANGYTINYTPSSVNSKVHVRAKINYKNSAGTEQLITFRLMRDITGGSSGDILMTDSSLGSITGVTNHGIYNLEYVDSPATEENVRYYLKFRIEAADADILIPSGVLGYDNDNQNFFSAQEIYIPGTYSYTPKECACEQAINYTSSIVIGGGSGTNSIAYSINNGDEWKGIGSTIFTTSCNGIVWSAENEKFIAVGSGENSIAYSDRDGIEWRDVSLSTSIFSTSGNGIVWNGIKYVAVGEGSNSIAHSGDGLYWRAVASSTSIFTKGHSIAYGNNRYIAVGEGSNSIAYSDDGVNWVGLGNSTFSTAGYAIIWNGSRWVAGGEGTNTLAISNDNGYSWIGLGSSIFGTKVMGLAVNEINMVAVGSGTNTIAYSSDRGISWTASTSAFANSSIGTSVSWVGERYIATSNDGSHTMGYSYDGINWTGLNKTIFSTQGKAISANRNYINKFDKYRLFSIDASFRHVDLSGNLEVSGNAQIDNILIDTNTISTTDSTGNLYITANNSGLMELTSNQNMSLTSQNTDVNLTSSLQNVNIVSKLNTNITSETEDVDITASQKDINLVASVQDVNLVSNQNMNLTSLLQNVDISSLEQNVSIVSKLNTNITSETQDVDITASQKDINLTSTLENINIISKLNTNITSQDTNVVLTAEKQDVDLISTLRDINLTSSVRDINLTSSQETNIISQNSYVSIQSATGIDTKISPSLEIANNLTINGNSIVEDQGVNLSIESTSGKITLTGSPIEIVNELKVGSNLNLNVNTFKATSGDLNLESDAGIVKISPSLTTDKVVINNSLEINDTASGFGTSSASISGTTLTIDCNNAGYGTRYLSYNGGEGPLYINTLNVSNLKNNAQITIYLETPTPVTFKGYENVAWSGCVVNFPWDQIITNMGLITITKINNQVFLCVSCFKT
tara:strand:+ start:771 stop:3881 length:3111 start_codon:yes stop_codon:yes gene_type:complete